MSNLKTLVLLSLVAGLTAPVLAAEKTQAEQKAAYEDGAIVPVLNDACSAFAIPFGTTTWYGTDHARLWFYWVGTGTGLDLETCAGDSNFDTDLRIYTGDCAGTLTQVYYRDGLSSCGWRTYLRCSEFTFLTGVTYYLRIDRYSNADILGNGVVTTVWTECAPPPPPPANNVMSGAYPIAVGECVTGSTVAPYTDTTGAYLDVTHLLCTLDFNQFGSTAIGASRDAWYVVDLPCDAEFTFTLAGSAYDTVLGIWDVNGLLVAGNDDFGGLQSTIECCFLPAGTYYISVDGYSSAAGAFNLCVSQCTECPQVGADELPSGFALGQNVPNPFNPTTTITFSMDETAFANLKVFDLAGRTVATLVNGMVERGQYSVTLDASNLTSGVYFYALEANGQVETRKMVLMK
jgi:hypothetical protein